MDSNAKYEAELLAQQQILAKLHVELDCEKQQKSDAMSYTRRMREDKRRNSSSSLPSYVTDQYEAEVTRLEDKVAELQLQLDVEKAKKAEAENYTRQLKEKRLKMLNGSPENLYANMHAEDLERQLLEKEAAEASLRAELDSKTSIIEELQRTCARQDESLAELRANLKSLTCREYVHSSAVDKDSGQLESKQEVTRDRSLKSTHVKSVSARGA